MVRLLLLQVSSAWPLVVLSICSDLQPGFTGLDRVHCHVACIVTDLDKDRLQDYEEPVPRRSPCWDESFPGHPCFA